MKLEGLPRGLYTHRTVSRDATYRDYLEHARAAIRALERTLRAFEPASAEHSKRHADVMARVSALRLELRRFDGELASEMAGA